jgi:hypothetical protein
MTYKFGIDFDEKLHEYQLLIERVDHDHNVVFTMKPNELTMLLHMLASQLGYTLIKKPKRWHYNYEDDDMKKHE